MTEKDKLREMLLSEDVDDFNLAVEIMSNRFTRDQLYYHLTNLFRDTVYSVYIDGDSIVRSIGGLYSKLRRANRVKYNVQEFSLEMFRDVLKDLFKK